VLTKFELLQRSDYCLVFFGAASAGRVNGCKQPQPVFEHPKKEGACDRASDVLHPHVGINCKVGVQTGVHGVFEKFKFFI
jgi:non-canonical (house-cleaning) NTP pyrophosphatase